jgi:uncharacterized protein YlxP (DUF503 family)
VIVGAGRIILDFFNNDDAALKRRKLAELCDDLRRKFNVSALEVADFEDPERCVIGFAAVIPESWKTASAEDFVEKVCRTIDETAFARVMVEEREMFYLEGDS